MIELSYIRLHVPAICPKTTRLRESYSESDGFSIHLLPSGIVSVAYKGRTHLHNVQWHSAVVKPLPDLSVDEQPKDTGPAESPASPPRAKKTRAAKRKPRPD